MPGSTWIRFTPTFRDARPVRLCHVPAMWPRSPRQFRASSQWRTGPLVTRPILDSRRGRVSHAARLAARAWATHTG